MNTDHFYDRLSVSINRVRPYLSIYLQASPAVSRSYFIIFCTKMTKELWKDLVCYSVQMENPFLFLIFFGVWQINKPV